MLKKTKLKRWQVVLRSHITAILMICIISIPGYSQFITTWKTDNPGTSGNNQITIPGTGSYAVTWEEVGNTGNTGTMNVNNTATITFPNAGTYKISITGALTQIKFNDTGDKAKILTIQQWGNITWASMETAFTGCVNLTYTATDAPNLNAVQSLAGMFRGCTSFNGAIGNWNIDNVTTIGGMFKDATSFNQSLDNWNTSKVTQMASVFEGASSFNGAIGSWKTGNVTSMIDMFKGATAFNQPIGSWNTIKVRYMNRMFQDAVAFDQPIGSWNVSNAELMDQVFFGATAFNQNLDDWNTSKATSMLNMFSGATSFNGAIGNWDLGNVTKITQMFKGAIKFNQPIGGWDISKITSLSFVFQGATAFNQDINKWNTTNVTRMDGTFSGASSFNQPLDNWNTSAVTNMTAMFQSAAAFNNSIGKWDVSQVTLMMQMFGDAKAFNQNINDWNTGNVVNMSGMFSGTDSFNQPLDKWNTSKVTDISAMFFGAKVFNQPLNSWNTQSVVGMNGTFGRSAFNQPLDAWNTANVASMVSTFQENVKFNHPIGSWNVSKVINMSGMFRGATGFNQSLAGWDITSVINMSDMLASSGLSTSNYDKTLTAWAGQNVKSNVPLGASGLKYCKAETQRVTLTSSKNWLISGDAKDCQAIDILVYTNGIEINNEEQFDFGTGASIVKTFTIENYGTGSALTLSGSPIVAVTAGTTFIVTEQPSAASIAAGASLTFKVTYTGISNNDTGTLSIASNDPDEGTFIIHLNGKTGKTDQAITFDLGNDASKTFGDAAFDLTATGGASGNPVTFTSSDVNVATISGNTVTIVGAGTATITANQAQNATHNAAAAVSQTLTIAKANQAIVFDLGNDASKTLSDAAFDLTAIGGASGNAITYTSSDTDVATISGSTVTIVGAGTTTITASQAGNNNYHAATNITQTLTVQSAITSLPEALKIGKLSVFPNPVSHTLRIKITGKTTHNYVEIAVLNQQGKKVLLMGKAIHNGAVEIPVDQLQAGKYLLQMNIGEETIVHRIVKL
ncbi:MAG TPA: hypothetical protein DCS93_09635 [Microscillaceae bacterium]|nr:hypothetical protein [Microscillaceae bacterium]